MKKILISILALGLIPSAFAAATTLFEGQYHCQGKELGTNEPYQCTGQITKTGETYHSQMQCDKDAYEGTGIYDQAHQALAVAFVNPARAEESGIAIMHYHSSGKFKSTWTYLNKKDLAHSVCEKVHENG